MWRPLKVQEEHTKSIYFHIKNIPWSSQSKINSHFCNNTWPTFLKQKCDTKWKLGYIILSLVFSYLWWISTSWWPHPKKNKINRNILLQILCLNINFWGRKCFERKFHHIFSTEFLVWGKKIISIFHCLDRVEFFTKQFDDLMKFVPHKFIILAYEFHFACFKYI